MQGTSLIKTFAILFGIVSIYQLSFTFISSTLENKARNAAIEKISEDEISFAERRASEEVRFLDSIGDLPVLMYSNIPYNKTLTDTHEQLPTYESLSNHRSTQGHKPPRTLLFSIETFSSKLKVYERCLFRLKKVEHNCC